MRRIFSGLIVTVLTAAPLAAQDAHNANDWQNSAGYITGLGGFQAATGSTTGDALIEGGVRVAPHVMVFGDLGWFRNLQSDLAPTLNTTVTSLQTNQGLSVTGGGTLPAVYSIGGVKLEMPVSNMFLPYVLGGAGIARLHPSPTFSFVSGVMPDGSSPTAGQDVTSILTSSGALTVPTASTAFMYTLGGGVQVPIASRWIVDAAYRYSRIAADTTLSAAPLNTNGMTFGIGYRF